MRREEKAELVAELGEKLRAAKVAVVTHYVGLTVAQTNQFRREVRGAGGECRVAKNTLTRRAIASTPYQASERWLDGQTALVFGYEDPIAVTKIVAGPISMAAVESRPPRVSRAASDTRLSVATDAVICDLPI